MFRVARIKSTKFSCSKELVAETEDSSARATSGVLSAASRSVGMVVPALISAVLALEAPRSLKALMGLLNDFERVSVISGEFAVGLTPLALDMLDRVVARLDKL